ncbi:MAG: DUF1015 domain-containing protein [Solirubrobacterales bacterium]|nr:DUF1015 domain-containing protein [Solirubrobacterales bacterium]
MLGRLPLTDEAAAGIRPHERTHPGPIEDRLRLARATKTNLSPIFALHPGDAVGPLTDGLGDAPPWGEARDADDTLHRLWRIADPDRIAAAQTALIGADLLIADGHHRYETARAYAEELGGAGEHRFLLALLVSLDDPGLQILPTHRLLAGISGTDRQGALRDTLIEHFDLEKISMEELAPPPGEGPLQLGYLDGFHGQPFRLTLKDQASADAVLPKGLRRLDTAVLEALILRGPVGLDDEAIASLEGLGYARSDDEARELVLDGTWDCAFFLRATPIAQVRELAAAGHVMPPKSTFFTPKVPTGLLFNPLV